MVLAVMAGLKDEQIRCLLLLLEMTGDHPLLSLVTILDQEVEDAVLIQTGGPLMIVKEIPK